MKILCLFLIGQKGLNSDFLSLGKESLLFVCVGLCCGHSHGLKIKSRQNIQNLKILATSKD
ncbi:hypothetical protein EGQ50_01030 [Coxiella endosymbiont of Amblyomma sculptum]|nr:hypothetical protein EGQ50_01030 [Coxiella endosymbiont of Amblyomma sculptum]